MMKSTFLFLVSALTLASGTLRTPTVPVSEKNESVLDVVISGGRVMDPESGLDAVRNVGIRDGKIAEISEKTLQGKQIIDAHGLLVAPGFIDLHEHGQEPRNYEFQAHDGVTTSLELEVGGALTVGMGINYTEAATHQEILEMFRVAAKYQAPVHVHVRFAGAGEPSTGLAAVEEVIAAAASTGAPLHVVHITSIGLGQTPQLIQLVEDAQRHGLDVTTECYPYVAASTGLESALFDPGWQERMGITYKDIQWAKTGERLTAETFENYRKEGGAVVIYSIPEAAAREAVRNPIVMIASDGMPITGARVHPRGQGTFSRVLGHYVREEKALDLRTALRKMTLMPAQRLEKRAPVFQNKGRIRVGADADITVFSPDTIIDKATFQEPLQFSDGIEFVLVNGVPVIKEGNLVEDVFPGRAARAPLLN